MEQWRGTTGIERHNFFLGTSNIDNQFRTLQILVLGLDISIWIPHFASVASLKEMKGGNF